MKEISKEINDKMSMKGKKFKEKCINNNIEFLYHADTFKTTKYFLENKKIFNRNQLKNIATNQSSDESDLEYGVNKFIFFDFNDLHQKYGINFYGPYNIKFSIDIIPDDCSIIISTKNTKSNDQEKKLNWIGDWKEEDFTKDFSQELCSKNMIMIELDSMNLPPDKCTILFYNPSNEILEEKNIEKTVISEMESHDYEIKKINCDNKNCKCHKRLRDYQKGYYYKLFNENPSSSFLLKETSDK